MLAQGDSLTDSLFWRCRRFYIDVRHGLLSGDTRTIFPWHPCKNRLGHATAHGRPPNIKAYACLLVLNFWFGAFCGWRPKVAQYAYY